MKTKRCRVSGGGPLFPGLKLERQAEGDWIAFNNNNNGVRFRTREIDVVVNDILAEVKKGENAPYPWGVKVGQRIEIRVLNA